MSGELLRLLILEAKQRASVEAECEKEVNMNIDDDDMVGDVGDDDDSLDGRNNNTKGKDSSAIVIRADHVTKIAAELLMDFS